MSGFRREPPAWLGPVAEALAEALPRLHGVPADGPQRQLIIALTEALGRGELDLPLPDHHPGANGLLVGQRDGPLVLEHGRLQWRRWQQQRQRVLEALLLRATACDPLTSADSDQPGGLDPLQQRAVGAVLRHRLVLLEGGPGTGKTSTVATMVAVLLRHQPQARVQLAAPTGKAAARLRSASGRQHACTTLHRLLESHGGGFGRHRLRPLELDLLVVDEVSMVDLTLMEAVLEALPASCRLVLVGDPAQLPPVAPGALLDALQTPAVRQALGPARITLERTWRNDGAIAAVAAGLRRQINQPSADLAGLLTDLPANANVQWHTAPARRLPVTLLERLAEQRRCLSQRATAAATGETDAVEALLRQRDRLLVLTPVRGGPWGVEAIHRHQLGSALTAGAGAWPPGTPVLCVRNRPDLDLANGDVGVVVERRGAESGRWLLFGDAEAGEPLWLHPAQLAGAVEPALALTVHKAQGSEAEAVVVLLDPERQPDPRLLYTALTRARRQALLITPDGPTSP
ncbi:MAG: AAA family ATPase [Cyanobacteriota bacterium]|nr:AAA family ATPase [Cyanobacteriota bacterium]